jgi:hypothetical protein
MDTDYYTYLQAIKDTHGKNWKRYIEYYESKARGAARVAISGGSSVSVSR